MLRDAADFFSMLRDVRTGTVGPITLYGDNITCVISLRIDGFQNTFIFCYV
jgi:hypothetical protein